MVKLLDVRGAKCPIPIVKAKKEMDNLTPGELLQVIATDPGSVADFKGWAKTAKHAALREQREDTDEGGKKVFIHILERTS